MRYKASWRMKSESDSRIKRKNKTIKWRGEEEEKREMKRREEDRE